MTVLKELILPPNEDGYSSESSVEDVIRVQLDGGAGRYRRDLFGVSNLVNCQWLCTAEQYDYLKSFYRVHSSGTIPFKAKLILDHSDMEYYECRFMPKSFRLDGVKGLSYSVSAVLEALPIDEPSLESDNDIVYLADMLGEQYETIFTRFNEKLDKIVNIDYPLIWGDWIKQPLTEDEQYLLNQYGIEYRNVLIQADNKLDQYINIDYPQIFANMRKGTLSENNQLLQDNLGPDYIYQFKVAEGQLNSLMNERYLKAIGKWIKRK